MSSQSAFTKCLLVVFALFSLCFNLAYGSPAIQLEERAATAPAVAYPHSGTVWTYGQRHNVTWDISNSTKRVTKSTGQLHLRKANSTTPLILAEGFKLKVGRIVVTVPWVDDGSDYQIVLSSDVASENYSGYFTINE